MKLAPGVRIKWVVWGLVSTFLAAIIAAASYTVWDARLSALAESGVQATRFVSGAESALNRSLLAIDVLLAGTDDSLNLAGSMTDWIDVDAASKMLRSAERLNLMVTLVALLDSQGHVIASSDPANVRSNVVLPAGFMEEALAQPVSTLIVSAPGSSLSSSDRVVYFARYIRMADGAKLLAIAEVPVDMITSLVMQGVDIPGLQVTLERGKGQLLLGMPTGASHEGGMLTPALADLASANAEWNATARLSKVPALVVSRPILFQDLWISASIPRESALKGWRSTRNAVSGATLVFAVLVLLAGSFFVTYLNRINTARADLQRSKTALDQALESMVSGFLLLDAEQRVVQWNRQLEEIFPWLVQTLVPMVPYRRVLEVTGRHLLQGATEEEHQHWVDSRLLAPLDAGKAHEQVLPDGYHMQITERVTPDGGRVITFHDVTAIRRASAEIESLAFYDPLTGLPNRRLLLDRVNQAMVSGARSGRVGALLFLDLDKFKTINDTLGHEVGDQLLKQVAERLTTCVRDADTVARLGGDEFVVMLKDLSGERHHAAALAQHIGEKILRSLNQPYTLNAKPYRSTCSLGATLVDQTMLSAAELLTQADIAMYQVKAQRGNALCFFDPKMQADISHVVQLEADLQTALALGQFELHYQPQFTLAGRIVGAEVLLRWRHPQRGLVSPTEFIAVAEERELIIPMGLWVLRTACQQLAAWQGDERFSELQLSVNVSARQFRQPDFVAQVTEVILATGIRPRLLKLELTESVVLDNVDDCVAKMEQLKTRGVQFSVDDFGTGYSSLAYLTRLPLNQLKIDQSFVRNLGVRHTDSVIVQTIIGMARNLGLEVIAEGVETTAQKELLAQHGCELYQGYLFARPAPVAVMEALLAA